MDDTNDDKNSLPSAAEPVTFNARTTTRHISQRQRGVASLAPARHIIVAPNGNEYVTSEGLAFTLGVAVVEAEITKVTDGGFYRIQHPNNVDIYHVAYMPDSGQVIVTRVGGA